MTTLYHSDQLSRRNSDDGPDPTACGWCEDDREHNAHTDPHTSGAAALASVAERTDTELVCWCGHSLHFLDCPDGGECHHTDGPAVASCRDRYQVAP